MNSKFFVIVLIILSLGLGIGLIVRHKQAGEQKAKDVAQIVQLSNDVVQTHTKLEEQKTVNLTLDTNLAQLKVEAEAVSNKLSTTEANFAKAQAAAKAAAEAAAAEVAKRDAKINELQGQNEDMTKKMTDLNTSLDNLEKQIAETEKKLASSEGDRAFLMKELKRLQAEKAQLEKQFNDLAVLREQVNKLKEELSISRRLEWIRQGLYGRQGQKGAESLTKPAAPITRTNKSDLNVELKTDGSVKIQSPAPAPAATNAPPK